ncbi:MAG TPA: cytochrome c maturation protein CcmE [Labilithrix sp.]|jgi:cytochrome c-type biogenesis protein CcmE|nr:cytochrome c maturation protein CcmE [Labilithrix sp.]
MSDRQADESAEDPAPSERAVEVPAVRRRDEEEEDDASRKRLLLVVPLLMAAAAIVALVLVGMQDKGIYSKPVDELVSQKAKFVGKSVRAEGNLVHGSLVKREEPCEYRFKIEKNGVEIPVRFAKCVVPDTFRDVPGMDVGVTVEGELRSDASLEASQVLAKCPSKYEMKQKAAQGERAPHAAMTAP